MNGVLLGISAKIDAIGLEIVNGKVGSEMGLLQCIYPNKSEMVPKLVDLNIYKKVAYAFFERKAVVIINI